MNSQPDKAEAAGTVYNVSLPFLKVDECERVKGQLSDIAQDTKEERQQAESVDFTCRLISNEPANRDNWLARNMQPLYLLHFTLLSWTLIFPH